MVPRVVDTVKTVRVATRPKILGTRGARHGRQRCWSLGTWRTRRAGESSWNAIASLGSEIAGFGTDGQAKVGSNFPKIAQLEQLGAWDMAR